MTLGPQFHKLLGGIRHYAWGQRASDGRMPFIPSWMDVPAGDEPWAEVWLGAHPSLPAAVELADGSQMPLDRLIASDPLYWCGTAESLPFLLKVLSCSHPLSIQSHPDHETARRLHALNPSAYPDPNDKTEIIIAVEPFEAMAGFRNAVVAREDIGRLTSLRPWLDRAAEGNGMRSLVTALFGFIAEESAAICEASKNELKDMAAARALRPAEELFLKLAQSYPGDRGALFAFLLNHIMLEPGEGCFLPPNSPHAYLNGVGIECMTNSDNVIRAGLTPKAVDVPTMLETLDFSRSGVTLMAPPAGGERRFVPPCASFEVWMLRDCALDLRRLPGRLMICAVLEGKARLRCGGNVIQAPCGTAWIRPAALSDGIIEAAETGAYVACATVQADNK